jgi:hypothetical protein
MTVYADKRCSIFLLVLAMNVALVQVWQQMTS